MNLKLGWSLRAQRSNPVACAMISKATGLLRCARNDRAMFLSLLLFSLLLFLPGLASIPVVDRDEAHFSQASRQMLQNHNYFQVRFQDTTRFQKPPGINWLQALSVAALSDADSNAIWPYRLPSTLGALFAVLLTWFFSKRFIAPKTAVLAAGLLASSFLLNIEAHMAVIDAMLLASIVLMQGALWMVYEAGLRNKKVPKASVYAFWLALSFGFVLKGVSPLFGFLSLIVLCCMEKNLKLFRDLMPFRGLLLFLLCNLSWLFLVNQAEDSNYLLQMIHKDLLPKLQGGHESHGKLPLFHLAILPLTFWPGSLFLLPAAVYAWSKRSTTTVKFLLAWLVPAWVFFECMPTKLPQYVLPLFPAIALLSALAIEHQGQFFPNGKGMRILQGLWWLLSLGLGFSFVLLSWALMHTIDWFAVFLLISIGFFSLIALYYALRENYLQACLCLFLMAGIVFPLLFKQWIPSQKPLWLNNLVLEHIDKDSLSPARPLLVVGFEEPGLVFNSNTNLIAFSDPLKAYSLLMEDPHRLALFDASNFDMLQRYGALGLEVRKKIKGFNYSKGKWVNLVILAKNTSSG